MTDWTDRLFREQADAFADLFERRFDDAAGEVEALLELVAAERGVRPETVLDVACGTGRHVLAFADRGCEAEGLDFSASFVEEARRRAADVGLADRAAFYIEDMRDLDEWAGSYDLVTSFWNSLGYYDRETDVAVLSAMRDLRSPDGVVAIQLSNKAHHLRNFESASVREVGNRLHVSRADYDPATGRLHTTIDLFDVEESGYEYRTTMEFEPRLYAPVELRELCEDAGFASVDLFGGFEGKQLTMDAAEVVVLAG